jgi:hypothetical protein
MVVARSSRPHLAVLGRVPGTPGTYSDLERHPENLSDPGLSILILDSPLVCDNALTVRQAVMARADQALHRRRPSSSLRLDKTTSI